MTLKMFKALWFLSVLVVLANLLLVYASLPEQVIIKDDAPGQVWSREWLFYISVIAIVMINVLVYLFKRMFPEAEELRAWFHGLVITINIFLIISLQAINVYNSAEKYDHDRMIFFIAGSLSLILLWAAIWPIYRLYQKIFIKQIV
ncbi:MAG: hypothetical protein ABIR06_19755 [Cyclobacteriaceae bacterium]